jgi:chemotaxis protein CheD
MTRDGLTVVGISEFAVTSDPSVTLVTYSLGSCVGLALFDPVAGVGGLLHAMMPTSSMNREEADANPARFADTGVATMLQTLFDVGAARHTLVAKMAGGSRQMEGPDRFRIGTRNHAIVRRVLWKNDILIAAEDCGGTQSRTLMLEMSTGRTLVKSNGSTREL